MPDPIRLVVRTAKQALLTPERAAQDLLHGLTPAQAGVVRTLVGSATRQAPAEWDAEACERFERSGPQVLIHTRWGRCWLAPSGSLRVRDPHAPTVSPKALRALSRAVIELLAA